MGNPWGVAVDVTNNEILVANNGANSDGLRPAGHRKRDATAKINRRQYDVQQRADRHLAGQENNELAVTNPSPT